ncbi:imm11 family protein [Myxococcus qinghaiensis]|uniref:imm11 family protein n=1 Tax=Myxococcus qinghaiensis TaxID=2906758 RepID=UPI0020A74131|nr:DUF1629 domain-containing protein [Myxococcus qinghaiensis]MCP3164606.1 hypothetical protein [Myxococcus qinghaiensis]
MNYFILNLAPLVDMSYCTMGDLPDSIRGKSYKIARGIAIGADYPSNTAWQMSDEYGGIKLPSLVCNTSSILVVERKLKDIIEATGVSMECLPFVMLNHKGREASRDYFIINPLGNRDCLNLEASKILWEGDEVVKLEKAVLDPDKLQDTPAIFRLKHDREQIVISHQLADALKAVNPTNIYLFSLPQVPTTKSASGSSA